MSFDVGSVTGSLKFDISSFAHSILEAQGIMSVFPASVVTLLEEPLLGFIEIAKEAGKALLELGFSVSETQNKTREMAEALGVSVGFLDSWGKAAQKVGGNTEEVSEIITHLSHAATIATQQGGTAADAFHRLGVQLTDSSGHIRPVEALLTQVSDGLHNMGGSAERTGIAMEVLGRGGASTLAFLGQGSAAINEYIGQLRSMGLVMDEETAKQAQAFTELWNTVKTAWDGILAKIAEPVRAALMPILNDLLAWMQNHPEEIKALVAEMAQGIETALKVVAEVVRFVLEHFDTLVNVLGAAGIGAATLAAVAGLNALQSAFIRLIPEIEAATAAQVAFNAAANGLKGAGVGAGIGALFGSGPDGTLGGGIGGGLGGIIGGVVGGPIGAWIGSAAGGAIGTGIGSQFDKPQVHVTIHNVNAETDAREVGDAVEDSIRPAFQELHQKHKKMIKEHVHLQNVNAALRGGR